MTCFCLEWESAYEKLFAAMVESKQQHRRTPGNIRNPAVFFKVFLQQI